MSNLEDPTSKLESQKNVNPMFSKTLGFQN